MELRWPMLRCYDFTVGVGCQSFSNFVASIACSPEMNDSVRVAGASAVFPLWFRVVYPEPPFWFLGARELLFLLCHSATCSSLRPQGGAAQLPSHEPWVHSKGSATSTAKPKGIPGPPKYLKYLPLYPFVFDKVNDFGTRYPSFWDEVHHFGYFGGPGNFSIATWRPWIKAQC